jgi:hypothetical protein
MNTVLLDLIRTKKELWYLNRNSKWKNAKLIKDYSVVRNSIRKLTRSAIRSYEHSLAHNKHDIKKLYAYVNSKRVVKSGINAISSNGKLCTDKSVIAETINVQFKSVFTVEDPNSPLPEFENRTNHKMDPINFDHGIVLSHLKNIYPFKSMGTDGISPFVLKKCAETLSTSLALIFQQSFNEGAVPRDTKKAQLPTQQTTDLYR